MDFDLLIPITLFVSIAYAIKATADAYTRRRIIELRGTEDVVRELLAGEAHRRRQASLHWGVVLLMLAIGFGLLEIVGANEVTPGVVAVLLGATAIGNLGFYLVERKLK